jgi:hypothetical protein
MLKDVMEQCEPEWQRWARQGNHKCRFHPSEHVPKGDFFVLQPVAGITEEIIVVGHPETIAWARVTLQFCTLTMTDSALATVIAHHVSTRPQRKEDV